MKKLLTFALFLGLYAAVMAQESNGLGKNRSVYLEVLGPSSLAGISYGACFNGHTHFGWRTGLNFDYGHNSSILREDSDVRGYAVPLEVNYLLGGQKSDLEVSVSASVGIYNIYGIFVESVDGSKSSLSVDQQKHTIGEYNAPEEIKTWLACNEGHNRFGCYFLENIGYRHVSDKDFLSRAGLSLSFTIGGKNTVKEAFFYPYFGSGWVS